MKEALRSPIPLGEFTPNIGSMIAQNEARFGGLPACAEREGGAYRFYSWSGLGSDVWSFVAFLEGAGIRRGSRVAFLCGSSYGRLVAELAVMAMGAVSVPIFAGYPKKLISELLGFAKTAALIVDRPELLTGLEPAAVPGVVVTDLGIALDAARKLDGPQARERCLPLPPSTDALIMFTSGTSGFPKGVQLSHGNILSQQKALELLWRPEPGQKLLSYLPWHHSFGGLFERFFALHSGGCLAICDSAGRNVDRLLENFAEIRPNAFFSVPKIHQEIVSRIQSRPGLEKIFFHPGLRFVFTAAAPLSKACADVYLAHGVPVAEGWGLTESSPCCTLTDLRLERRSGLVGQPIPGVEIRLGDDNEILVRGPNVMKGYLDRPEETARVLDREGWLHTGDIGEILPEGLRILSRKDRMFKLSNGEKVFPAQVEESVKAKCRYVKHAYLWGKGQAAPGLMLIPDAELFSAGASAAAGDCRAPRCPEELAQCLARCLCEVNEANPNKLERVQRAVLVTREPTLENHELTPSFKLVPSVIEESYAPYFRLLEGELSLELSRDAFRIEVLGSSPGARPAAPPARALHYGVIGLGPVGAIIASYLLRSGNRVTGYTPIAGQREALLREPLRISGAIQIEARIPEIQSELAEFVAGKPDVVILATKTVHSAPLLRELRELGLPETTILVAAQNGLDVEKEIADVFGSRRALRLVLNFGCRQEAVNRFQVGFFFTNYLSEIDTASAVTAARIADDLNAGGFKVELRVDYRTEVFKKVILNSALSPVCSILGLTMKAAMSNPESLQIVKALIEESILVARASGVKIPEGFETEALEYLAKGGDHKPSMAVDIEQQRRTENDDHSGRLVEVARSLGLRVPVTETIFHLMRRLEDKVTKDKGEAR